MSCKQQEQRQKWNQGFGAEIKGSVQNPAAELTGTQDKKRKSQLFCFAAAQGQNHTVKHKKGESTAVGTVKQSVHGGIYCKNLPQSSWFCIFFVFQNHKCGRQKMNHGKTKSGKSGHYINFPHMRLFFSCAEKIQGTANQAGRQKIKAVNGYHKKADGKSGMKGKIFFRSSERACFYAVCA